MQPRDVFTLVKDALCMTVALAGGIFEGFIRQEEPRLGLLGFYVVLLGFGTAAPAALSLFSPTNQAGSSPPDPGPAPVTSSSTRPVDLQHPRRRRRGDDGTTSSHSRSRR